MQRMKINVDCSLDSIMEDESVHIECAECGSTLDDEDDRAFILNTGECPYCHTCIDEIDVEEL